MSEDVTPADTSDTKYLMNHNFGYALPGDDVIADTMNVGRYVGTIDHITVPSIASRMHYKVVAPGINSSEWKVVAYTDEGGTKSSSEIELNELLGISTSTDTMQFHFQKVPLDLITEEEILQFRDAYVVFSEDT